MLIKLLLTVWYGQNEDSRINGGYDIPGKSHCTLLFILSSFLGNFSAAINPHTENFTLKNCMMCM
jgi:hypothetical protein